MEVEIDSQVIDAAFELEKSNRSFVLAVVTKTWGSSPRQAGSMMVIEKGGHMVGSVSGGCVEGEVVLAAKEVIDHGKSQTLNFSVANENAWEVGLSCDGAITVFICPSQSIEQELCSKIKSSVTDRKNISIICDLKNGKVSEAKENSVDKSYTKKSINYFEITFTPKPRVFIIGAVQISQHLIPMARESGFEVVVIDPRSHFGSRRRFPDTYIHVEWPDEVLQKQNLSEMDSLVTLTHDPKIDDDALSYALRFPLSCISCLGSKRTNNKRRDRLASRGYSKDELGRLNAPAGIDIGSKTPAEIAVSILAQLIKSRRSLTR